MPNDATVSSRWRTYLPTVDDIEEKTGYDFLSTVTDKIQSVIEAKKDANWFSEKITVSTTGRFCS